MIKLGLPYLTENGEAAVVVLGEEAAPRERKIGREGSGGSG